MSAKMNDTFRVKEGQDILSPREMLELPRPGGGTPNPAGDFALITVSCHSFQKDKTEKTLHIVSLNSSLIQAVPLSEHKIEGGGDAFWLDSRTIGYIAEDKSDGSGENKGSQHVLYAIAVSDDGEASVPIPLGHFPRAVKPANPQFCSEASILAFTAFVYDDGDLATVHSQDIQHEKRGNTAKVYDATYVRHWDEWVGPKRSSLFTVSLQKGTEGWVLGNTFGAPLKGTSHHVPVEPFGGSEDYALSREHIIYTTIDPENPQAWHTRQNVYVVPLSTSGFSLPKQLTSGTQGQTHTPTLSPSGVWAVWLELAEDGYESDRARVVLAHIQSGIRKTLDLDKWDRSPSAVIWNREGTALWLTVGDVGYVRVYRLDLPSDDELHAYITGKASSWVPAPVAYTKTGAVSSLAALPNDRLVYALSTFTGPNELHLLTSKDQSQQLTNFAGPQLSTKADLFSGESYWFEGANNVKVQGWILKPYGYKDAKTSEKKWPAILLIHGGPQGAWSDQWSTRWNANVFAQQGYFVIAINPTGSTTFGQAFTDAITKDWGGAPFVDLRKGWEAALQMYPSIDRERTAAAGASWGGFAVNWIQGHPEYGFNFKALIAHAGVFDTRNMGFITEEVFFYNHDFGGVPWEGLGQELGHKFNPANFVKSWGTPQLCIHGSKDYRLSEIESLGAFNALQQLGIPSRLVVFPDENHWVLKPGNSLHWHYEVFRWLDKFIGRDPK